MTVLANNRRAHFDYEILETFEAGLSLLGFETKAVKKGMAKIQGAYVIIRNNRAMLLGMHIPPYQAANSPDGYDPDRTRELLLHKKEIKYLTGKSAEQGLTLVPLKVYTRHNLVKLEFGLARGKKAADKRQKIRAREEHRKIFRVLKGE